MKKSVIFRLSYPYKSNKWENNGIIHFAADYNKIAFHEKIPM